MKLDRKQELKVLYQVCVFCGPIGKTRWPPWPLIGWDIFDFSSETAEQNSTKLDRKQDLNVLYQVCVFGPIGRTRWPPGLWLAETFSTSPLKPLNRIQRNLTGSKILMSSTKFVFFFWAIGKTRWPPWPLIGWDIFDFSSETVERNSMKLDRKQDLKVLYQVCVVFGPIGKTRWPPWPLIGWDVFDFSSETAEQNSTKLDRKQDLNVLYQFCVFWADRKKDGRPGLWLAETFSTSPLKPLNRIQRNLTGSKILMSSTNFVFFGLIGKKMAALASDWLRHFRLLLWNRWTEFNETWQEARS